MFRLRSKSWWGLARGHWEAFFWASAAIHSMASQDEINQYLAQMQTAHDTIAALRYPPQVREARAYLLLAMEEMLLGFKAGLAGEDPHAHMHAAQAYLTCFDETLTPLIA